MRDRLSATDGSRACLPRIKRRALAWAAAGLVLALAGCGDLSLYKALEGDSPGPFQLSPDSLNLPVGSEYSFTAVGGIAPYRFASAGVGLLENQTWKYTAPSSITDTTAGWDLVIITASDLVGNSDTAAVRVFQPFELAGGTSVTLTEGDPAHSFSASGGVAPYTWLLDEAQAASGVGSYDFDPQEQGTGTYILAVRDDIGNYREATVTVLASSGSPLVIDPTGATVLFSSKVSFNALGGDGPNTYLWSATAGTIAPTGPKSAELTAPGSAGELTVTLSSSSGTYEPITARVVVTEAPPVPAPKLGLLPEGPIVDEEGDIVQFNVAGGTPPYRYLLKNQYKNWATITAGGLYTHLKSGKNVVVTVEDYGAPVQSASTTVYWQE
jgi:hypothetical protein